MERKRFDLLVVYVGDNTYTYESMVQRMGYSIKVEDTVYKTMRFLDGLKEKMIPDHLPRMMPGDYLKTQDGLEFRLTVTYPLIDKDDLLEGTPWSDDPMLYNVAKWHALEIIIEQYADMVFIIKDVWRKEKTKKVVDICERYNKSCYSSYDYYSVQDLYKIFTQRTTEDLLAEERLAATIMLDGM